MATFRDDNGIILRGKANENICAGIRVEIKELDEVRLSKRYK